jgi:DNA-binding transcriptional ArsR family regulator
MTAKSKSPTTDQLLRALNHSLRRRILRLMNGETKSPGALAAELGEPLPSVSYHVRVLCECDVLRLVRAQPVRGSIEHFYHPVVESDWARAALSDSRSEDR